MEDSLLMQCAAIMGISMTPVLELRGAIPFGLAMGLPVGLVYIVSVIGNMVPVPAIILFVRSAFRSLRKFSWLGSKISKLEQRAHLKGRLVRKYRILGLIVLVAIPLPGTGAWTGALVAALLGIRIQLALPTILLGVMIAGGIMTAAACGVSSLWF